MSHGEGERRGQRGTEVACRIEGEKRKQGEREREGQVIAHALTHLLLLLRLSLSVSWSLTRTHAVRDGGHISCKINMFLTFILDISHEHTH